MEHIDHDLLEAQRSSVGLVQRVLGTRTDRNANVARNRHPRGPLWSEAPSSCGLWSLPSFLSSPSSSRSSSSLDAASILKLKIVRACGPLTYSSPAFCAVASRPMLVTVNVFPFLLTSNTVKLNVSGL